MIEEYVPYRGIQRARIAGLFCFLPHRLWPFVATGCTANIRRTRPEMDNSGYFNVSLEFSNSTYMHIDWLRKRTAKERGIGTIDVVESIDSVILGKFAIVDASQTIHRQSPG